MPVRGVDQLQVKFFHLQTPHATNSFGEREFHITLLYKLVHLMVINSYLICTLLHG